MDLRVLARIKTLNRRFKKRIRSTCNTNTRIGPCRQATEPIRHNTDRNDCDQATRNAQKRPPHHLPGKPTRQDNGKTQNDDHEHRQVPCTRNYRHGLFALHEKHPQPANEHHSTVSLKPSSTWARPGGCESITTARTALRSLLRVARWVDGCRSQRRRPSPRAGTTARRPCADRRWQCAIGLVRSGLRPG